MVVCTNGTLFANVGSLLFPWHLRGICGGRRCFFLQWIVETAAGLNKEIKALRKQHPWIGWVDHVGPGSPIRQNKWLVECPQRAVGDAIGHTVNMAGLQSVVDGVPGAVSDALTKFVWESCM